MAKLLIEVDSKTGVRKATSRVSSVSEADSAARLSAAIALQLTWLNDAALESAGLPATIRKFGQSIWVPRVVDEDLGADRFEQIELGLAEIPRSLSDEPPLWIVGAMRKAYPDHFAWKSVGDEYVWTKPAKEEEENPLGVKYGAEAEKSYRILGDSEIDVALTILTNMHGATGRVDDWFINESCCGWVEDEKRGTLLVSDLYSMNETRLAAVQNFAFETGLKFSLSGISSHHPSKTFRLSIGQE